MVPRTRRRVLRGTAAAVLTGLAGCSRSTTDDPPAEEPPQGENVERNPDSYALRNDAETPPAWVPDERSGRTTDDATAEPPDRARTRSLVATEEAVARMGFADVDGAEEARRFASDTDFGSETLYVESQAVDECRTLELCYVTWSAGDVETQYGGHYRDADVSCEADARDAVSWLIRIPDVLDPDAVTGYGSGWSSRGCERRRRERDAGTTTDAPQLGPATNATRTGAESPDATSEGER